MFVSIGLCKKSAAVTSFLAGSFSGTCSTIIFQPLDLIKTRLQLLHKSQHSQRSVVGVASTILRDQKLFGLWTGLVPVGLRFCVNLFLLSFDQSINQ